MMVPRPFYAFGSKKTYRQSKSTPEYKVFELYRESNVQQLAFHTIRAAVVAPGLSVVPPENTENVELFVDRLIEAMLVAGFAVFSGLAPRATVVNPLEVTVRYSPKGWIPVRYNGERMGASYSIVMLDEPLVPDDPKDVVRAFHWTSAARRSVPGATRVIMIEEQWLQRDRVNSRAAAFTTVDKDLKTVSGNPIPFFLPVDITKNAAPNIAGQLAAIGANQQTVLNGQQTSFSQLIHGRANALRQLTRISANDRDNNPLDDNAPTDGSLSSNARAATTANPGHTEHIITDGREFTAVPHLPSTTDAKQQYDRARHSVLYTFGVPPQATGESVNSERTAANALQYEIAMQMFEVTIQRIKGRVTKAFSVFEAAFAVVLFRTEWTPLKVRELGPYLTVDAHISALAQAHRLPKEVFDRVRVNSIAPPSPTPDSDQ